MSSAPKPRIRGIELLKGLLRFDLNLLDLLAHHTYMKLV